VVAKIDIPAEKIAEFCEKWKIREFSFFGSVLGDSFGPDSDVDVLVSFLPESQWDLFDLSDMRDELAEMFHRPVDLVEKEALRNPIRRRHILNGREVVYAREG